MTNISPGISKGKATSPLSDGIFYAFINLIIRFNFIIFHELT